MKAPEFYRSQLRQLHEKATDMPIRNYKAIKAYYERQLTQVEQITQALV